MTANNSLLVRRLAIDLAIVLAIALLPSLWLCSEASAHGVVWDYSAKKAIGLEFGYDDQTHEVFRDKRFRPQ